MDADNYEPPDYFLDDEIYAYEQHCCDHCGHTYANSNEEDLGYCRHCQDQEEDVEDAVVERLNRDHYYHKFHCPDLKPGQPDLCPRCGAKDPEVAWQTFMVTEPTLVVQCQECGFHSYGVAKSKRAGRKDWELRRVVVTEWNQMVR